MLEAKHLSIAINRSPDQVYTFAVNPENLPQWASGLSGSINHINGDWFAESPMGLVKIKFAETNKFGILDHEVTLPSGATFYNPMRVLPNQQGSEVVFTLYRQPEMTYQEYIADEKTITKDLLALKKVLEGHG